VYEVTGVADILRGQTDPNETLGAQELKAQTGSRRVRNTKDELARFARDVFRLVCEAIAENFSPETLADMTGYKYVPGKVIGQAPQPAGPPVAPGLPALPGVPRPAQGLGATPPPGGPQGLPVSPMGPAAMPGQPMPGAQGAPALAGGPEPEKDQGLIFDDQVIERLRADRIRSYSIDIETDSTIQPDEDAEKQRRTEFATMFAGFLKQAAELFQLGPIAAPLLPMVAEALKFVVRGFRAGRQLEDSIDRAMDQLLAQVKAVAAQPPKPSPEEMKIQAEAKAREAELAFKQREGELANQLEVQKAQLMAQIEKMKADNEMALATQKAQFEMALAEREFAQKSALADREATHKAQMAERQAHFDQETANRKAAFDQQDADRKHQLAERDMGHTQEMDRTRLKHDQEIASKRAAAQPSA
jgi:hypothetical protein